MSLVEALKTRSKTQCELCNATDALEAFEIPPAPDGSADQAALLCTTCREQIEDPGKIDVNHWRCLNDSMWTQIPAVQVLVWRMLKKLRGEGWPQDLLDMLYLDDATLAWAESLSEDVTENDVQHRDSNGTPLMPGDSITLIKDLNVKGGGFTAKRGTVVRNISLVQDNPGHIEGRVNGQQIVILTKFVKKAG